MADSAGDQRVPLLVFVHIPKTAGTTLTTILNMNQPGARSRALGNVFKGGGGVKRGVKFERIRGERGGLDLEGVNVLTGHFPLGMRKHLPKDRDVRSFTFLREPADRTLSHYFQIRRIEERDRAQGRERSKRESLGLDPLPVDPTLDDMVEGGYVHDNLHTRMLCGDLEPFGEVTEDMLAEAKRNLRDELVFFGLMERFDESLVLAKRRLGLSTVLYKPPGTGASAGRVNAARPRGEQVPDELLRAARKWNRYDIELYRYANELFDDAPELEELEFQVELAALRVAKPGGEADLEAPAGFGGDEEAWRLILADRVALLRHERELAEVKALVEKLAGGDEDVVKSLQSFKGRGKRVAGRDPDTAVTQVIRLLAMIGAALRERPEAPARSKVDSRDASSPSTKAPTRSAGAGDGARPKAARGTAGGTRASGARRGRRRQSAKRGGRGGKATGVEDGTEASGPGKRTGQRRRRSGRASTGGRTNGRAGRKGRRRASGGPPHD
jgi:Sulfotransferase family